MRKARENPPPSYEAWLASIRGKDGVGIADIKIENGKLYVRYTNSDEYVEIGQVQGADGKDGKDGIDGKDGKDGVDGKNAYRLWLEAGNTGSQANFLNWLETVGTDPSNFSFTLLNDGTYGVAINPSCTLSTVSIPLIYQKKPVTKVMKSGFARSQVTSVILPESVTVIENGAFFNVPHLPVL